MEILFIGGPFDGQKRECGDDLRPYYEVPVHSTPSLNHTTSRMTYRIERYSLNQLQGSTKPFYVYTMSHLTGDDVIERLLDKYSSRAR